MTVYKKVAIPRPDGFDQQRRTDYHRLLRYTVFPFVDDLIRTAVAEGYDFLTHSDLELRLWLRDDADLADVQTRLREAGLPDELVDWPPSETGDDRVRLLEMLRRGAEQVRALLDDEGRCRTPQDVVHWFLNQYGLHNYHEVEFHRRTASAWEAQLRDGSNP